MAFKVKIKTTSEGGFKRITEVYDSLPKLLQDRVHEAEEALLRNDYVIFRTDNSYFGIYDTNYIAYFPKNLFNMAITQWHYVADAKKGIGIQVEGVFIINKITISMTYYFKEGVLPKIINFI